MSDQHQLGGAPTDADYVIIGQLSHHICFSAPPRTESSKCSSEDQATCLYAGLTNEMTVQFQCYSNVQGSTGVRNSKMQPVYSQSTQFKLSLMFFILTGVGDLGWDDIARSSLSKAT